MGLVSTNNYSVSGTNPGWTPPSAAAAVLSMNSSPNAPAGDRYVPQQPSDEMLSGKWRFAVAPAPLPPAAPAAGPTPQRQAVEAPGGAYQQNLAEGKTPGSKTYYVLMSGMGDPNSQASLNVRTELKKLGVDESQCIIPKNFCGSMPDNPGQVGVDGTRTQVFQNGFQYLKAADPNSTESGSAFTEVQAGLTKAGFNPKGGDRVVLIGHSLGGQRALTLAENMEGRGTPADAVVTLGSPLARNQCRQTPVTNVYSSDDPAILGACNLPQVDISPGAARALRLNQGGHKGYTDQPEVFASWAKVLKNPNVAADSRSFQGLRQEKIADGLVYGANALGLPVLQGAQDLLNANPVLAPALQPYLQDAKGALASFPQYAPTVVAAGEFVVRPAADMLAVPLVLGGHAADALGVTPVAEHLLTTPIGQLKAEAAMTVASAAMPVVQGFQAVQTYTAPVVTNFVTAAPMGLLGVGARLLGF